MNKIILDSFKFNNYYERINLILKSSTHRQCVQFALACAKDLDQYYNVTKHKDVYNTRKHCLDLVGKWLLDPKSVTKKELYDAVSAANAAAYAASAASAAYAAACAAASAAYAAASAAASAASAAYAAACAADSAASAAAVRKQKEKELFYKLLNIIECNNIFKLLTS